MKLRIFWIFLLLFSVSYADPIVLNGIEYDDETVSKLITVITSTSPISSHPSTEYLYAAQKSLFHVSALAKCKKIIVFDAPSSKNRRTIVRYEKYKKNVQQLVQEDPYFSNTELIFCKTWGHLTGTLKEAIAHVDTPFVFIHQHDLILLQGFDLNAVIATMTANPKIRHVLFGKRPNTPDDHYHGPVEEAAEESLFVPLCRTSGWSDQCHVAFTSYYTSFVLPQCSNTFMEDSLHPALKEAIRLYGKQGHEPFGTYLYGKMGDGPYMFHMDARKNGKIL
jgi:hypothetical protein